MTTLFDIIRGVLRLLICLLLFVFGGTAVVLASYIPVRIGGYPLAFALHRHVVHALVLAINLRIEVSDPQRLRHFAGLLFPNHVGYLDILVLFHAAPCRFLAKDRARVWPIVGQVAKAIGCVFVKREDKGSRAQARAALAKIEPFPPAVIFPEGRRGPGDALLPFRYGAFGIAGHSQRPVLPLVIVYNRQEIALWQRHESVFTAFWRLLSRRAQLVATVHVLPEIRPLSTDDPVQLAHDTYARMNETFLQNQHENIRNQGFTNAPL